MTVGIRGQPTNLLQIDGAARPKTEGEGFEPSVDRKAHNGFRDRAETAAMPHHNWSLRPGGIQGGMNFGARAWATHRQRSATVLLAWGNGALLVSGRRSCTSSDALATRVSAKTPPFMG